jgi:hypothetical protein
MDGTQKLKNKTGRTKFLVDVSTSNSIEELDNVNFGSETAPHAAHLVRRYHH